MCFNLKYTKRWCGGGVLFGSVLRVQSLEGSKEFDLLVLPPRGVCNALTEYEKRSNRSDRSLVSSLH